MLAALRSNKRVQLAAGLAIGVGFGFLLQRGGVTRYEVVIGQLLLQDFTVVKIMLTAIVTGMIGVHALCSAGWATLSKKSGSVGSTVVGGLIFGVGFAVLGYCPGTMIGAVGQGSLDALFGMAGMLVGTAAYAAPLGCAPSSATRTCVPVKPTPTARSTVCGGWPSTPRAARAPPS